MYKPEAPRLRRNLSAIINFAKFREEKLAAYTELQEQCGELVAGSEAGEAEQAALRAELARLRQQGEAQLPEAARVQEEQAALYAENQSLNKQQAALSGDVRALKQAVNGQTDAASQLRYALSQARGQGELLQAQIVQSPEKLQALLLELEAAVERERAALGEAGVPRLVCCPRAQQPAAVHIDARASRCVPPPHTPGHPFPTPTCTADRRSRELASRLDVISRVEKEVVKSSAAMAEVEAECARKKDASRTVRWAGAAAFAGGPRAAVAARTHDVARTCSQVKALRSATAVAEHEAAQLAAQHQHLKRQQLGLQERVERLAQQCSVRRDAVESSIEQQLRDREAIDAENAAAAAKRAENDLLARALRERIAELQAAHESQLEEVLDRFHALRGQVGEYHALLAG